MSVRGRGCHDVGNMDTSAPSPTAFTPNVEQPRRAHRSTEDAMIGGIAAGLAEHLGLPVLWVRAAMLGLVAFGGFGAVLYAGLWLVLPAEKHTESRSPGLDAATLPWMLLLYGVGSTIGVFIGGRLADWKLMPSLIALLTAQAVVMAAMYLAAPYPIPMIAVVMIWGGINFAVGTPVQTRILRWTADAPNLASSLIPSGFNIGIAIAASIGGLLLSAGWGYRSLPVLGVAAMAVAVAVASISYARELRRGSTPPLAAVEGEAAVA